MYLIITKTNTPQELICTLACVYIGCIIILAKVQVKFCGVFVQQLSCSCFSNKQLQAVANADFMVSGSYLIAVCCNSRSLLHFLNSY